MLRLYVAGAYSANNVLDVLKNIGRGRKACAEFFSLGFAPFCPWHDMDFIIMNPDNIFNIQQFRDYCLEYLKVSQVMFILPDSQDHEGVQDEIKLAKELNIPRFEDKANLIKYKNIIESNYFSAYK